MGATSKRDQAAILSERAGLTRLIEFLPQRACLLVLNYHRIGDAEATPYDPGVFSATAEEFLAQVSYLRAHFEIVTLNEAIEFVAGSKSSRRAAVLITFDDGYLDNYECAFPILRSQGVPAAFFLTTGFIGTDRVPLWDTIAYLVKSSQKKRFRLDYPSLAEFDIQRDGTRAVLRRLRCICRFTAGVEPPRFLSALQEACEVSEPTGGERIFMNWNEAAALLSGGMAIGSHAHTHEHLARLTPEEQYEELRVSRATLEHHLGTKIEALSYPAGTRSSFSAVTYQALVRAGYRAAFSFYGGVNIPGRTAPFDIQRIKDGPRLLSRLRLEMALSASTGSNWM